jgi:hypothetical protein
MSKISRSQGRVGGMGLAIAGTIISGLSAMFLLFFVVPMVLAIALPAMMVSKVAGNEASAIATLSALSEAQGMFRDAAEVDQDGDGTGEYGFLSELAGAAPCRGSGKTLQDPYLSPDLGLVDAAGVLSSSGYNFKVYLPLADGTAAEETTGPPAADAGSAPSQAARFLVYAWPQNRRGGRRTFVLDQSGAIFQSRAAVPPGGVPGWDWAFRDLNGDGKTDFLNDGIDASTWARVR